MIMKELTGVDSSITPAVQQTQILRRQPEIVEPGITHSPSGTQKLNESIAARPDVPTVSELTYRANLEIFPPVLSEEYRSLMGKSSIVNFLA